jgi:hypothetical protein
VADETLEDILHARQNEERLGGGPEEENGELEQEVLAQPVAPQVVEDELEEETETSNTVDGEEGAVGNEVEGVELEWDSEHEVVEDVENDIVEEVDGAGGPSAEGNVLPVVPVDVIVAKKRKAVEPPKQAMKEKEGKYWFRGTKHSCQWYADDQESLRRKQARPRSPMAPAISDDSDF